ncbi:MAG: type II toxin-antitoxin system VapC family toxin [Euzebyaceae bacterium]|nr:type II toxin-antitoxin system VapC family toxin [Euzebyaceae bacterium]
MARPVRGLLDTSVIIARAVAELPQEAAISAATLAELHFGVLLAGADDVRRARIRRLAEIEARFDPLPVDAAVARSYGALAHVVVSAGRQPRRRTMDLLIAATAHAHRIPLYTRDAADFAGIGDEISIHVV